MGILSWIVFGLITGVAAKWIFPGRDPRGTVVTILLGVAGAVAGGMVGSAIGFGGSSGFDIRSLMIAIAGAIAVLFSFRLVAARVIAPPRNV